MSAIAGTAASALGRTGALAAPPRPAQTKPDDDPKRVAQAARQFESLLIGQLLKSMREAGSGGWMGTGDDKAGAHMMELAEEQLAESLAEQGGLGLAKLVAAGLEQAKTAAAARLRGSSPDKPVGGSPGGRPHKTGPDKTSSSLNQSGARLTAQKLQP